MKKAMEILSSLVMLASLVAYGYGNDEVSKEGKVFCDGIHTIVRICGYYGIFGDGPCSEVFSMTKKVFHKYGFTDDEARIIGQGCVYVCTTLRENVLSIVDFESNTNTSYLDCLRKYGVKLDIDSNNKTEKKK
ncbi:MAG: hypothetical protein QXL14_03550 [Candidatus Aenigmatarchaeota archaeon]